MIDCKYTPKDLSFYLLNKMTPEKEAEFQFHLDGCEDCRKKLEKTRRLAEGLKENQSNRTIIICSMRERIKPLFLLKIAASIAAIFVIGYLISRPEAVETYPIQDGLQPERYHQADTVCNDSNDIRKNDSL